MCGRYTLTGSEDQIAEHFQAMVTYEFLGPRYNIAPSQLVPVVRQAGPVRTADPLRWGFIPAWAKDKKIGYKMINARSEEIASSYKSALKSRRCLIPADGWYEWRDKKPYHFHFPARELFAFAGLWEQWQELTTFTIFTTGSAGTAAEYHDRMPVILPPTDYSAWLDQSLNGNDLTDLLQPWEGDIDVQPANQKVGNVRNQGPELLNE